MVSLKNMQAAPSPKYLRISWSQFNEDTVSLSKKLINQNWKGIVAITRGGLVPANILAYELDIKLIDTICISSYDDQDQKNANIIKKPESADIKDGSGWLVVDDLIDTGKTAEIIRAHYPKATFVTTYAKTHGKAFVDHYSIETTSNQWILLPWDEDPEK